MSTTASRLAPFTLGQDASAAAIAEMARAHGLCIVPGLYADLMDAFDDEFERSFRHPAISQRGDSSMRVGTIDDVAVVDTEFPTMRRVFHNPLADAVASRFFRQPIQANQQIYIAENFPVEERLDTGPFILHYDCEHSLKWYVYIEDADESCGPFEIAPDTQAENRRHRIDCLEQRRKPYQGWNILSADTVGDRLIPATGTRGTLLVFDPDCSHRAGHVHPGHRRRIVRGHTISPAQLAVWSGGTPEDLRAELVIHV